MLFVKLKNYVYQPRRITPVSLRMRRSIYSAYIVKSANPCHFLNLPCIIVGMIATAQAVMHTGKSKIRFIFSTGRGCPFITAHKGRISVVSIMFAPIILPTEREFSFLRIAVSVVTNSGSDVPRAIIVKPIIVSLIPTLVAIVLPEETRNSAPKTIAAVPIINHKI